MHRVSRRAATLGLMSAIGLAAALAATPNAAAEPLVQAAWLAGQIGNPHVVVLDIRPAGEYLAGHIPGAVSADYRATGWTASSPSGAAGALPPVDRIAAVIGGLGVGDADTAIIVGDDFAGTARVYWTFKVLGHAQVALLDGGLKAWTGAVENRSGGAQAGRVYAALRPGAARATAGGDCGGRRWSSAAGGCASVVAMERRGPVTGGAGRGTYPRRGFDRSERDQDRGRAAEIG